MKAEPVQADRVKIFTSGNSQAIRLPKKFRLPGQTARIEQKGKSLIITPEEDAWARFDRGIKGMADVWTEFDREQPAQGDTRSAIFP